MSLVLAKQPRAPGGIYRAATKDPRSPIAYRYPDTLAVYFNQSPLFQVDTSTEVPEDQDSTLTREQARNRPRVVLAFHANKDSLRLSGLLVAGEELAGRPAVLDASVGRGHVVLFAMRPFWRWETQGRFARVFQHAPKLERSRPRVASEPQARWPSRRSRGRDHKRLWALTSRTDPGLACWCARHRFHQPSG